MIKFNEYFDGNVCSLGYDEAGGRASVGVMQPGSYTFGTEAPERMVVVSGFLDVQLPGKEEWRTFTAGSSFDVGGSTSFNVRVETATAYLCLYR